MNTKLIEELREVQRKAHLIRTSRPPLTDKKIQQLESLMDREEEIYEELGPEFLENLEASRESAFERGAS